VDQWPDGRDPGPKANRYLEICISNISPRERRKRLLAGVIQFVINLAVLAALIESGANRWWRLPLFLMFWGAVGGFFQWRDKT
jgi:fatty acid desaturase